MIGKIVGAIVWMIGVAAITMAAVSPQQNAAVQILTYLLWFCSGAMLAHAFARH